MESSGRHDRNELLFRAVNEKLRILNVEFEGFANELAVFVCECDEIDCMAQIAVSVGVFDAVCAQPFRYVVFPGHHVDGAVLVSGDETYTVVERPSPVD